MNRSRHQQRFQQHRRLAAVNSSGVGTSAGNNSSGSSSSSSNRRLQQPQQQQMCGESSPASPWDPFSNNQRQQQQHQQQRQRKQDSPTGDSIFSDDPFRANEEDDDFDNFGTDTFGSNSFANSPTGETSTASWTSFRNVVHSSEYRATGAATSIPLGGNSKGNGNISGSGNKFSGGRGQHRVVNWPSPTGSPTASPTENSVSNISWPSLGRSPVESNIDTVDATTEEEGEFGEADFDGSPRDIMHQHRHQNSKTGPSDNKRRDNGSGGGGPKSTTPKESPKVNRAREIIQQRNQRRQQKQQRTGMDPPLASLTSALSSMDPEPSPPAGDNGFRHEVQRREVMDPPLHSNSSPRDRRQPQQRPHQQPQPARAKLPLEPTTATVPEQRQQQVDAPATTTVTATSTTTKATTQTTPANKPATAQITNNWKTIKAKHTKSFETWVHHQNRQAQIQQKRKKQQLWDDDSMLTDEMSENQLRQRQHQHHHQGQLQEKRQHGGSAGKARIGKADNTGGKVVKEASHVQQQLQESVTPVRSNQTPSHRDDKLLYRSNLFGHSHDGSQRQHQINPPSLPLKKNVQRQQGQNKSRWNADETSTMPTLVEADRHDDEDLLPSPSLQSSKMAQHDPTRHGDSRLQSRPQPQSQLQPQPQPQTPGVVRHGISQSNEKPPLSPNKVMLSNNNLGNSRVDSVRARRLLWGGQLLQDNQEEEDETEVGEPDEFNPDDIVLSQLKRNVSSEQQQPTKDAPADEDPPGGLSMVRLVENAIQEATWKTTRQNQQQQQQPSSTSSKVRWPPPHPDRYVSSTSPKKIVKAKAASNGATTHNDVSPSDGNNNVARMRNRFMAASSTSSPTSVVGSLSASQGRGHQLAEQSPTRSDHSADAAAGMYFRNNKGSLAEVRRRIFGPLDEGTENTNNTSSTTKQNATKSGTKNGANAKAANKAAKDEMRNLASGHARSKQMSIREIMRDDASLDATGQNVQAVYRNSANASRSIYRAKPSSGSAAAPGVFGGGSFDSGLSKKVSWDDDDINMPQSSKKTLNLEAKLSQLHHQPGIGRSHTFDSATGNRSKKGGGGGASVVSIQPSVESECVRQNAEIALAMEDTMMDFFAATDSPTENIGENVFDDDGDDIWGDVNVENTSQEAGQSSSPGSCFDGLKSLAEKENTSSPCCNGVYSKESKVDGFARQEGDSSKRLQYTSLNNLDNTQFPRGSPGDDDDDEEIRMVSTDLNSHLLMPAPSVEYDDPSLFDNSLMSDSSSELTPMLTSAVVAPSSTSHQQQKQRQQSNSNKPTALTMQLAKKTDKDLTNFLDRFDTIFQGCNDGDNDSSDVFFINNSQMFGKDDSAFGDNSQFGGGTFDAFGGFGSDPFANLDYRANSLFDTSDISFENNSLVGSDNNTVNQSRKSTRNNGQTRVVSSSLSKPAPLSRVAPLKRATPTLDEDSTIISEEDNREDTMSPLPPASTFLSAKDRARIRQHDTTPLRTNTSRAARNRRMMRMGSSSSGKLLRTYSCEASMSSIKEDIEDDDEDEDEDEDDDREEDGNGGLDPSGGQRDTSLQDDKERGGSDSSWSDEVRQLYPTKEEDLSPRSKMIKPDNKSKQDPPSATDDVKNERPEDGNDGNDGNEVSASLHPAGDVIKMTFREKRKGHSLHWQAENGVNEDETMYDAKTHRRILPPSSRKRAGLLAGRLNLLSISSHTATFRKHFGDDNKSKRNSLYHPSYANDDESQPRHLGLIKEEGSSFEDNEESRNDDESCADGNDDDVYDDDESINDLDSQKDEEESVAYTHDEFVRDFKDILSSEKKDASSAHEQIDEIVLTETAETNDGPVDTSLGDMIAAGGNSKVSVVDVPSSRLGPEEPSSGAHLSSQQHAKEATSPAAQPIRFHMQPHTVAQRRETRVVAHRRHPPPPKPPAGPPPPPPPASRYNQQSTKSIISNTSGQHPHHVPVKEPSKSRLEEKLRGISSRAGSSMVAKRDSNNSIGTSELGSILTKESDTNRSLQVPRMIFHRTHPPKSPGNVDDGMGSARSSPSSMQNTYMNATEAMTAGVGSATKAAAHVATTPVTPSDDGCRAISSDIASQVKILLPDDDENELLMNCPPRAQPHPPPPPRANNSAISRNGNHQEFTTVGKNDKEQIEDFMASADVAIAMIDEALQRTGSYFSGSSGGDAIDDKESMPPRRTDRMDSKSAFQNGGAIQQDKLTSSSSSKEKRRGRRFVSGKKLDPPTESETRSPKRAAAEPNPVSLQKENRSNERSLANSGMTAGTKDGQQVLKTHIVSDSQGQSQKQYLISRMKKSNSKRFGDVEKVQNFWSQLDNGADEKQSRSASSSPEAVHNSKQENPSERLQPSNTRKNNGGNNNSEWQHQPRQIPALFNKKSAYAPSSKMTDDASAFSSYHSSIFEAFEVAPLRTTPDSRVVLNDFGVHHSYVKRGKKKVGFPETAAMLQQRQESMPPLIESDAELPPPITLTRNAGVESKGVTPGIRESASDNDEFEVMLHARNLQSLNLKRGDSNKDPINRQTRKAPSATNNIQNVPINSKVQQKDIGSKSNKSSHKGKIQQRLKRMVMSGVPGASAPSSSSANNHHNNRGAGAPAQNATSSRKLSSGSKNHQQPPSTVVGSKTATRRSIFHHKNSSLARRKSGSASAPWIARKDASGNLQFSQRS